MPYTFPMDELNELIRHHDNYQFEIKLGYDLNREEKKDNYRVETFFFLPNNLDVNESTYSKNQFYRDLLLYIRFKTPDLSLKALADPENTKSPLYKINTRLSNLSDPLKPEDAASVDYEIRLAGCIVKSALRDQTKLIERLLRDRESEPISEAICKKRVEEFTLGARLGASAFRALREKIQNPFVPPNLHSSFLHTDEYISLLIEGRSHELLRSLSSEGVANSPEESKAELVSLIREEIDYRKSKKYPSVVDAKGDNEVFLYRLSVLKKFISSVLHLKVNTEEEGKGLKQFAMAVGAGIAMLFAAGVAFYYQKRSGAFSTTFFMALVISYMFKDRIKAFSQNYFQKILARRLFDQQTDIVDPFLGAKIGVCREIVQFREEKDIDAHVVQLRNRDHITEIENDWRSERVIYYVKEIVLKPAELLKHQSRKTAVTDIMRFSIRNFLWKMDEPQSELFYLKGDRSEIIQGHRVYHVNIIVKFTSSASVRYERIRLILTRNGIKHIEPVLSEVLPTALP